MMNHNSILDYWIIFHIIVVLHEQIMVLLAGWDEVRRQGIRNVVTLSFDPE